jgi:hypothetical protein
VFNNNTMTLLNVTLVANSATAVGVGGGYYENGVTQLRNTLFADNTSGGNFGGFFDASTSLGHNYSNDASDGGFLSAVGDIVNPGEDPLLGPLADNGGPTFTHELLPGSPAIDAADPNDFPETDQRGITRPQGPAPDIGAFEVVPVEDTIPPEFPESGTLTTSDITTTSLTLDWTPAEDNIGVTQYLVFQDGVQNRGRSSESGASSL